MLGHASRKIYVPPGFVSSKLDTEPWAYIYIFFLVFFGKNRRDRDSRMLMVWAKQGQSGYHLYTNYTKLWVGRDT